MNENLNPGSLPEVPWPTSDQRMRGAASSMLTQTEKASTAAVDSLNRVVHGAHDAVDRFADSASPRVRQLGESVAGAETALREKADQMGRTRDEWAEGVRNTVRSHPLAVMAAAVALGAVFVRLMR